MKKVFRLILFSALLVSTGGIVFWGTGCDEIKGPCEIENTINGDMLLDFKFLESWPIIADSRVLRFYYPNKTIPFVCTDSKLSYSLEFNRKSENGRNPEIRLIWKYEAPKPSKAILTGEGRLIRPYFPMGSNNLIIKEYEINLAYNESAVGGLFLPGFEIRMTTTGNLEKDFEELLDTYKTKILYAVTYRMNY